MTPKQKVLKRWPKAFAKKGGNSWLGSGYFVFKDKLYPDHFGTGPTPAAAWRNAAERMK